MNEINELLGKYKLLKLVTEDLEYIKDLLLPERAPTRQPQRQILEKHQREKKLSEEIEGINKS